MFLLFLVLGLVVLRAVLPVALQAYVNRTLDRAENYNGRVGNVDLSLLSGSYSIGVSPVSENLGLTSPMTFSPYE